MKRFVTIISILMVSQVVFGQVPKPGDGPICPETAVISQHGDQNLGPHYYEKNGELEEVDCFDYPVVNVDAYFLGGFYVSLPDNFIPGVGEYPEMYLCAFGNDFDDIYGVSTPLSFEYNSETDRLESNEVLINLEPYFSSTDLTNECTRGDFGSFIYVSLGQIENGTSFVQYNFEYCLEEIFSGFYVCCPDYSSHSLNILTQEDSPFQEISEKNEFVGFEIKSKESEIMPQAYPNPFRNNLTFKFNANHSESEKKIYINIIDIYGQELLSFMEKVDSKNEINLNLELIPKGIYLFKIKFGTKRGKDEFFSFKIVKS